jgi:hypothetical protein
MEITKEQLAIIPAFLQTKYACRRDIKPYEFYILMVLCFYTEGKWFQQYNYLPCHHGKKRIYQEIIVRLVRTGYLDHQKRRRYYKVNEKSMYYYQDMIRRAEELLVTFGSSGKTKAKKEVPRRGMFQGRVGRPTLKMLEMIQKEEKKTDFLSKTLDG